GGGSGTGGGVATGGGSGTGGGVATGGGSGTGGGCNQLPGIVAWWDGDSVTGVTAHDIASTHDGTMIGAIAISPAEVGTGFDFGFDSGVIEAPDHPALNLTSALTLEAWVKPTLLSSYQRIVSKQIDNNTTYSGYILG